MDTSKGDREVTDAVENILPELPGTMGLSEPQLGQIQGVGMDEDSRDDHGGEISDSENESEMGSENDVAENNGVSLEYNDNVAEENILESKCEQSNEEGDQSSIDLANAFEARLDAAGLDTPPVLPILNVKDSPPQDPPPNFVNRFGREVRPQRFLLHESFAALAKAEGVPELWRPSTQTSYGMH